MKITLENTTKMVQLQVAPGLEVPSRIWEGKTESGIPVHCYITRIAVAEHHDQEQFQRELQEQRAPSPAVEAIPFRLIL